MSRFTFTLILFFQIVGCAALQAQTENLINLSKKNIQILSFEEGDSIVPALNAKRIKAIYGLYNEKTSIDHLSNLIDPEEIHLKLRTGCGYSFDFLSRFSNLRVLSISYFSEESNPDICGHFCPPLDISFLKGLSNLEILILEFEGKIWNLEPIASLNKLIYLKVCPSSFSPDLFVASSLQQIELGEQAHLSFNKSNDWIPLKINYTHDHRDFFSIKNKAYRQFLKQAGKLRSSSAWPSSMIRKNSSGDTLVYMSEMHESKVEWKISLAHKSFIADMPVLYTGFKEITANGTVVHQRSIYPSATCYLTQENIQKIKIVWDFYDENNQKTDSRVNEYTY